MDQVFVTKFAQKQIERAPRYIQESVFEWVRAVRLIGLAGTRKVPGYHDEPLKGKRQGQRSVRLNKAYRLFYQQDETKGAIVVTVIEVNKHEY